MYKLISFAVILGLVSYATSQTFCTLIYSPVCGSDGRTYSNECFFAAAQKKDPTLTFKHKGACGSLFTRAKRAVDDIQVPKPFGRPTCACPRLYRPVCGSDGITYANSCLFDCAKKIDLDLEVAYKGICKTIGVEDDLQIV